MQEHRRQHYLKALGIAGYEPRWLLAGAAASGPCEWGEPLTSGTDSGAVPAPVEKPAPGALRQALDQVSHKSRRAPSAPAAATHSEPTVAPPVNDDHKYLAFSLSVWQIGHEFRIVDSRRPRTALPTDTLLLNILRALGYPLEQLPAGERLRTSAAHIAPDDPVAYAQGQVQAYLLAQQDLSPVPRLLLMGAAAARFALPIAQWPSDGNAGQLLGQWFTLPDTQQEALVLPSLTAMLQNPQLKAVAWQALKPLVQVE